MLSTPLGEGAELTTMEPWQAAELAAFTDRHRAHLEPWLPWTYVVHDEASARRFLQKYADSQARDAGRIFAIRLDGELVGNMIYRLFDTEQGSCELGAWLAPEAQGRGLVTRAAGRMIDWAVDVRGLSRVEWLVNPANKASIAVARRLGMTHEGTMRSLFEMAGERHDMELWALLDHEWRETRGR
ncbi:GNAT family N-acetyltransferase [Streptomyces sp. MAR4 CNX-425]|uniref:GNAT family N-acetyltransferase n=1 Tax=Streptomyces sp. MAR4 CNX-425 TaxID=3406343 RepID=UPI003B50FE06